MKSYGCRPVTYFFPSDPRNTKKKRERGTARIVYNHRGPGPSRWRWGAAAAALKQSDEPRRIFGGVLSVTGPEDRIHAVGNATNNGGENFSWPIRPIPETPLGFNWFSRSCSRRCFCQKRMSRFGEAVPPSAIKALPLGAGFCVPYNRRPPTALTTNCRNFGGPKNRCRIISCSTATNLQFIRTTRGPRHNYDPMPTLADVRRKLLRGNVPGGAYRPESRLPGNRTARGELDRFHPRKPIRIGGRGLSSMPGAYSHTPANSPLL